MNINIAVNVYDSAIYGHILSIMISSRSFRFAAPKYQPATVDTPDACLPAAVTRRCLASQQVCVGVDRIYAINISVFSSLSSNKQKCKGAIVPTYTIYEFTTTRPARSYCLRA